MQAADLKFPGDTEGTLRREVAHAISRVETAVSSGAPIDPTLAAFLVDAASKTPGYAGGPTAPIPANQRLATGGTTRIVVEGPAGQDLGFDASLQAFAPGSDRFAIRLPAGQALVDSTTTYPVTTTNGEGNEVINVKFIVTNGVITGIDTRG